MTSKRRMLNACITCRMYGATPITTSAASIEFRSHVDDPLWRAGWDFVFCAASTTLAILFGAALANLIRGVPIDANGWFALTLFTHFRTDDPVGILDWYTVLVGLFALLTLMAHGGTFLAWKTDGAVGARSRRLSLALFVVVTLLWPFVTWATRIASPGAFANLGARPLAWLAGAAAGLGLATALRELWVDRALGAFVGSCVFIAGLLGATAALTFPVLLRSSSDPSRSLTAHAAAAAEPNTPERAWVLRWLSIMYWSLPSVMVTRGPIS